MGAGNSSQYEHVFRSAEFKNVYTQFHALKLTTNEIKQLYTHFRNIDVDGGGTVTLEELLVYLDLDTTPYTQRIFTIFDKDGSGEIDFTEFALSMWNYCTLTPSTLDMFAFSLYDMDGSGYLSATEVEAMMHDIYGNSRDSKVESKFLTKNIIQDLHRKERNGDEFNLDDFRAFARDHQALLFPAFQMQFTLQRKVMGYAFWKKHAKRRIALSNGSYVTVENFLSINMRVRKTKQAAQVRDTIDQIGPKFSTADTAGTRVSTGDSTAAAAAAAAAAPAAAAPDTTAPFCDAFDALTLTVTGGDIPLAGDPQYHNSSGNLPSAAATVFGTVEDGGVINNTAGSSHNYLTGSSSSGSLKEETLIHKSTNMASFYYRKRDSSDQLKDVA